MREEILDFIKSTCYNNRVKNKCESEGVEKKNVHDYRKRTRKRRKRIASFQKKVFPRRHHRRFEKEGILRKAFRKKKEEVRSRKKKKQKLIEKQKPVKIDLRAFLLPEMSKIGGK